MSKLVQCRDSDANNQRVELMTTNEDLTSCVRAIVAHTAAAQTRPSPILVAQNSTGMPSTSAEPPHVQATYRKVAQRNGEQAKQPKLILTVTYKREPTKANQMARVIQAETRHPGSDPMTDFSSFHPFARGAATTVENHSAASGLITRKPDYHSALSASASTNPPILSFRENPPRPMDSSTQQNINAKRNLALSQRSHDGSQRGHSRHT